MKNLILLLLLIAGTLHAEFFPLGSSGGGGSVIGTTGNFAVFTSSSAVGNGQWLQGTNGEMQFKNLASAKGTFASPLFDLVGDGTHGTGFYSNSVNNLLMSENGLLILGLNGAPGVNFYDGTNDVNNFMQYRTGLGFTPNGTIASTLQMNAKSGDNSVELRAQIGSIAGSLIQFGTSDPNFAGATVIQVPTGGPLVARTLGNGHGVGLSTGYGDGSLDANAWSVQGHALTNVMGHVNPSTSTTLNCTDSCLFWQTLGFHDMISTSFAATNYAYVLTIPSTSQITVSKALGDGSSQTWNKKQALLNLYDDNRNEKFIVTYDGKIWQNAETNGSTGVATCNSTTEVSVANTSILGSSTEVFLSYQSGTPTVVPYISSKTANTGFGFKCGVGDTTSVVAYNIVEPKT